MTTPDPTSLADARQLAVRLRLMSFGICGEAAACIRSLALQVEGLEQQAADHRRNVRLIDAALHGEDSAAKQASTCDLIDPARALRTSAEKAERELAEVFTTVDGMLAEAREDERKTRDSEGWRWFDGRRNGISMVRDALSKLEKPDAK